MARTPWLGWCLLALSPFLGVIKGRGDDNLCPNPGFEEDGGPAGPKGWEGDQGAVQWDDTVAHSGRRSAKVFSEGGRTVGWTSDPIRLPKPGCRFVLEGWAKLDNVSDGGALLVLYTIGRDGRRNGQTAMVSIAPPKGGRLTTPWTRYIALGDVLKPEVYSVRAHVRLYGSKGTAWFDDISVRLHEVAEMTTARRIRSEINLVKDQKAMSAILPAKEGGGCAEQIQQAIREATGVAVPIESASSADPASEKRDMVLLGNLDTNPFVEYLYVRSYTYEDRYFPGPGGYVIRPLLNPLGTGANFVIIGASDESGLRKGTDEFVKVLRDNAKPGGLAMRLKLVVQAGEGYQGTRFFPWPGSSPRRELGPAADYLKSGNLQHAQAYRERVLRDWFVPDEKFFSEDEALHLHYVSKTQSWDLMESSGVFSDEERLRLTKRLLDMMRSVQGYEFSGLRAGMISRENHGIRAATAFYFGWRYFKKYHEQTLGVELALWEARLRDFWQGPFGSDRSYEDSLSQHAFAGSLDNTLTVAFCEPEWSRDYFGKGHAGRMGERCLAVCNNLGQCVQQGDTGASDYPADVFDKLAYRFHDGRYLYMLRKRGKLGSSSDDPFQGYVINLQPVEPRDHLGVRVIPADPLFYHSAYHTPPNVPIEKTFDKLTFRGGFDAEDVYLMLDGTAGGSHSYDDANTIGEFSAHDRIWLCQPDIFNGPTMNFHNAVVVALDGLGVVEPPQCAELVAACQGERFGYTATALRDYNGVDWVRHVFWMKKGFFFVLDELRALKPGGYSFVCNWRGLGKPGIEKGLYSASGGDSREFFLRFPSDVTANLERDTEVLGPYVNPHPWHDRALNVVTQSRSASMGPGDVACFANLFWSVSGAEEKYNLQQLDEHSALVSRAGRVALIGGGERGAEAHLDGLDVGARFFQVDGEGYVLVGPSILRVGGTDVAIAPGQAILEGRWAGPTPAQALAQAWETAAKRAMSAREEGAARLPDLQVRWASEAPEGILSLAIRRAGGRQTVAVGGKDGTVSEFGADGARLGTFQTDGPVHALCAHDLDGDGAEELLVGSDDECVYALDSARKPLWKHQVPFLREEQPWLWWTLGSSKVRKIVCDDVDGDGAPEVIVGAGNMRLNVLNRKGEPLWRFRTDHGIPTTIMTSDLFAPGRRCILCGNGLLSSNGTCWVLSGKGALLKSFYNDPWCTTLPAIAVGDPNGDGKKTLFCGNNRGNLRAYDPDGDARKPLWIRNLAGPVRRILVVPKGKGGVGLVAAASDSGCLTAFQEDGKKAWVTALGAAIIAAEPTPDGAVAAGGKDGTVFLVAGDGKPMAVLRAGEALQGLLCDQKGEVFVATERRLLAVARFSAAEGGRKR